jgi:DNA-binding GntR family transcriptional regulator
MDLKAFKDVFDLRIALECLAVEQSIPRIPQNEINKALDVTHAALEDYNRTGDLEHLKMVDYLVHELVIRYCDNPKLIEIMEELRDLVDWARSMVVRQSRSYDAAIYEHLQVLEALKIKDASGAVSAMRTHLRNSFERTSHYWNELSE